MTSEQKQILTNIIGAVESGGQVYGNRRYDAYAGAYANSPNEVTCTLGWAQNYGYEAMKLCKMILEEDPKAFHKADTAGIEARLNTDWVAARWNPNSDQKQALIAIITTDAGKKCQDTLFGQLMDMYLKEALAYDPSMSVQAQMMWCEIEHLGGLSATRRIFDRATKPYTVDSVYASLLKDQNDTSNNNQVGDKMYQSRHQKCVEWIKKYVKEDKNQETVGITAKQILDTARGWLGWSEASGKWWQIVDGVYNNYIRSHRGAGRGYILQRTDAWCDAFVSSCFIKNNAVSAIGDVECGCPNHIQILKNHGLWLGLVRPMAGDIVFFDWQGGRSEWGSDHIGLVEAVNGNTVTTIEGNRNDSVARRTITWNDANISGYARPKYGKSSETTPVKPAEPTQQTKPTTTKSLKAKSKSVFTLTGTGSPNNTEVKVGKCTADLLNVRSWAGVENPNIKSYPQLAKGNLVSVCDSILDKNGSTWYFVKIANKSYGFVSAKYIELQ